MDRKSLFREAALKHLSSPEQLDQLIQVISVKAWLLVAGIFILLCAFSLWLVFGSVPTYAEGDGILLAGGGKIFSATVQNGPSRVESVLVKPGDKISKGQQVAILSRSDLKDQIDIAKKFLADLTQKYERLSALSNQEKAIYHRNLEQQRQALTDNLKNNQIKLKNNQELLKIKQNAYQKGIQTLENLDQTLQSYYSIKSDVEDYPDKISQLAISEANFNDQWRERLRELELKIADAKNNLNNLEASEKLSTVVVSPISGVVINIQATMGSILETGAPLLTIANEGKGLDALVFLPPQVGKRIKPDMEALVTPTTVEKAEYGSIYGIVVNVAAFPTTAEAIQSNLQNSVLVKKFTDKEVPIEVRIRLEEDSTTISGFKWSSSKGPDQTITAGNLVTTLIIIRRQAPITLVIPAFKKITGIQ